MSFPAAIGEREAWGMRLSESPAGTLILGPQALRVKSLLLGTDSSLLPSSAKSPVDQALLWGSTG